MSKPVQDIVVDTVVKDCPGECPYRYGDGAENRERLGNKVLEKVKHRVADGNDVRKLESRIKDLEKALSLAIKKMENKTPVLQQELTFLKNTLKPPKRDETNKEST